MLRRLALLAGLFLLLAACAAHLPVPERAPTLALPMTLHIQREVVEGRQDWLLVLQDENPALRWSLFDPLGVPLARQRLEAGIWHNDGLLPPNAEARELFIVLLFALTPSNELASRYPQAQRTGDSRRLADWLVRYRNSQDFSLERRDGPRYQIAPLPAGEVSR